MAAFEMALVARVLTDVMAAAKANAIVVVSVCLFSKRIM